MLLYQFNKGDERAFKKLFDDFFKSSCAFVKRYIPDHGAVEDVVQETFINHCIIMLFFICGSIK